MSITWDEIKRAEPRLISLQQGGILAVLSGCSAEEVYGDIKPFVESLIGWRRGFAPIVKNPTPLQRSLAKRIEGENLAADTDALHGQRAYEVTVAAFFDSLAEAADTRGRAA